VSKTIYSTQHNVGVLRFVDAGTKALELENGQALNEPTTYAVRIAIEQAVYDMIIEGEKKGIWRFQKKSVTQPTPITKEEKKDELVQTQTSQASAAVEKPTDSPPPPIVPIQRESNEESKGVKSDAEKATGIVDTKIESPVATEERTEIKIEPKIESPTPVEIVTPTVQLQYFRYLKQDSFVYKEPNEKSQRTWLLKKGTEFNTVSPGPEGWYYVVDAEKRKGYVRTDVLSEHKP
jgi:hypothetical protein